MNKKLLSTRNITLVAIYAAMFMAVDLLQNQFGFFQMPNGGSLGVSATILLIASYHLGFKLGTIISLISVILQFTTGKMYLSTGIFGFFLDYVLGYGIYGSASLFKNYKYFYSGVLITNLIRLASSTLSGILFYQFDFIGSLTYNLTYMLPTIIVTLILVALIDSRLAKLNLYK